MSQNDVLILIIVISLLLCIVLFIVCFCVEHFSTKHKDMFYGKNPELGKPKEQKKDKNKIK